MQAHLYMFCDASPSDWLIDGHDDIWHTIACFVFQSDPALQPLIATGLRHDEVLSRDGAFNGMTNELLAHLPSGQVRKWKTGPGYRSRFCSGFAAIYSKHRPMVSACSFQEGTLRVSKQALLQSYNQHVGGIEGRGIGFEESNDAKGRRQMKHSFVNFHGHREIEAPDNQMLVVLFMSWFIADQYVYYRKEIVDSGKYGFDQLGLTVVSDKLSGDDDTRPRNERNLRHLIDPDGEGIPIVLTRSPQSDSYLGDLVVDNLAGWLNAAISDPKGEFAALAKSGVFSDAWNGWHLLVPSTTNLESIPATIRLNNVERA